MELLKKGASYPYYIRRGESIYQKLNILVTPPLSGNKIWNKLCNKRLLLANRINNSRGSGHQDNELVFSQVYGNNHRGGRIKNIWNKTKLWHYNYYVLRFGFLILRSFLWVRMYWYACPLTVILLLLSDKNHLAKYIGQKIYHF